MIKIHKNCSPFKSMINKKEARKVLVQKKREKKRLTRLRKGKVYKDDFTFMSKIEKHNKLIDNKIISSFKFELDDFINENGNNIIDEPTTSIKIPKIFSLEFNYKESIDKITLLRKSILKKVGETIEIDFSICEDIDFSILFLMKVLLEEYLAYFNKLNRRTYSNVNPKIRINHSSTDKVNLKLYANNIISNTTSEESDLMPIYALGLIKGSKAQKHYSESKKGPAITKIRSFINDGCLKRQNMVLGDEGIGYLDGLLSEILNNAEDHSPFNTWYAFGNLFETKGNGHQDDGVIGEINLAIFNFGYSIFEGFEKSKEKNFQKYNEMESIYNYIDQKSIKGKSFTKENLFTLVALQEGFSRVKYRDSSRGTGTMKFLKSFINLGDYEDKTKDYNPRLLIYSGSTTIKCDNEFKPFEIDGVHYLSLNKENDISLPPSKSHLKHLEGKFPGTLLVVKIYLNENHLKQKIENNGN